jgi:hypothetical protein
MGAGVRMSRLLVGTASVSAAVALAALRCRQPVKRTPLGA